MAQWVFPFDLTLSCVLMCEAGQETPPVTLHDTDEASCCVMSCCVGRPCSQHGLQHTASKGLNPADSHLSECGSRSSPRQALSNHGQHLSHSPVRP